MYPEMVQSLAVIDSVSELDEVVRGVVTGWKMFCDTGDGEKFFWGMAPNIYGAGFLKENYEMLKQRAKAIRDNPNNYLEGQKILYDTFAGDLDLTGELDKIQCPVLFICGQDDILKPPKFSQIMADKVPESEFVVLPGCGHVAIFEKPKELESVISGFILKHRQGAVN